MSVDMIIGHVFKEYAVIEEILIQTSQHFDTDMCDVFFEKLGVLELDITLAINCGFHEAMTGTYSAGSY